MMCVINMELCKIGSNRILFPVRVLTSENLSAFPQYPKLLVEVQCP